MRSIRIGILGLIGVFVLSLGLAWTGEATTNIDAAKTVFETKCAGCHGLDKPRKLSLDEDAWRRIVGNMQAKKKSWISDQEAEQILSYLVEAHGPK